MGVEEHLLPDLEREELPDLKSGVAPPAPEVGDEAVHLDRPEEATPADGVGREQVVDERGQFVDDPATYRRAETGLRPVDDRVWDYSPHRLPKADLALAQSELARWRHRPGDVDDKLVDERHTHLD